MKSLIAWIVSAIVGLFWLVSASGCTNPKDMTPEQIKADAEIKLGWVDKAVEIAERHDVAYRLEVNATGAPSVGAKTDFYFDTGLRARFIMFGNGGSDQPRKPGR